MIFVGVTMKSFLPTPDDESILDIYTIFSYECLRAARIVAPSYKSLKKILPLS